MGATEFSPEFQLEPLKEVETELRSILALWPGQPLFLNESFSFANLDTQRRQHQLGIVHLATHGKVETDGNLYIYMTNAKLSPDHLRQLNWNKPPLELLVLSACDTAYGGKTGQGFAGIAHNFGVKSAIGSLWSIRSESTVFLMTQFYQSLKTMPIKAEALRQAQLTTLTNPLYRSPFYWAPFVMIGNPW
jgi:CHAT domain-containing protein